MKTIKRLYLGQSLFEVMFAIGIAALVMVAVVSLSTQSVKTSDSARNNAIASKYAQEGLEWVRRERDESWANLTAQPTNVDISLGDINSADPWGSSFPDGNFTRTVKLTPDGSDTFVVEIKVTWTDSGGEHQVVNTTKLSDWRN